MGLSLNLWILIDKYSIGNSDVLLPAIVFRCLLKLIAGVADGFMFLGMLAVVSMCVCVCIYVCIYVCMHVCVCVCECAVCIYVCDCMCMYVYVCVCMCMHVYVCICICMCVCMCMCMYMHMYMHMHIYMYVQYAYVCLYYVSVYGCVCIYICMYMCINMCMYVCMYVCMYIYICVHSHLVVAIPILVELFLGYLWGFMVVRLWRRPMDVYGYEYVWVNGSRFVGISLWTCLRDLTGGWWGVSMVTIGEEHSSHPTSQMPTITLEHVRVQTK